MALSDEINSCSPIPGAPTGPRRNPRDQIFCDNVTVERNLVVNGEAQLDSININGTTYIPAIIEAPGPLASVVMSLPDGTPVKFLPGTTILIAVSSIGTSTLFGG
jgi:hypothetical protein